MSWKEDILREFGISLKQDYPELTYILIFYFSLRDFFNPKNILTFVQRKVIS